MTPVDVLITGFVKSAVLAQQSLSPLLELKQQGTIRDIHYVTWDTAELDGFVAPVSAVPQVRVARVPQPPARGNANQRGVIYQTENLRAGLALLPKDGLILKTRLDMVARAGFLRGKILNFARDCAVPARLSRQGVTMPAPVLHNKIWIPWADSNQPFFYEDALFLGAASDIARLATTITLEDIAILGNAECGPYAHVVRYARIFQDAWPMFRAYLKNYRCFANDIAYRKDLLPLLLDDGYFWHLLIAHAWILHSQFHVDIGAPGDLCFHPNTVNPDADWSRPETLNLANPYDDVETWRIGTKPDEATHSVRRVFGRLMDDLWQTTLFSKDLPDFPQATLKGLMENVATHRDGRLNGLEREFYTRLAQFHRDAWEMPAARIA